MYKQDFYFDLPPELIAQHPLPERSDSRLLVYHRQGGHYEHQQFKNLVDFLNPGDLLVMNDSKVIPARFYGSKASGGRVEFLVERLQGERRFLSHIKASKAPKPDSIIHLEKGWHIRVLAKIEDLYQCEASGELNTMLDEIGHIPLPLYITRQDDEMDLKRYQTVYARHKGSVAAPTAGLHFDDALMQRLQEHGVRIAYATLHVGAGTFRPVRCDAIKDHKMHGEQLTISEELARIVNETKAAGHRVIAVGTTAMRSLESSMDNGCLLPGTRETNIFIYPGYQFKICDGLITNFHLPESTLLMLVAAFIGHPQALDLYREAILHRYRFFSYGDASLLL
ncbi:tRNA preQ1(34) S-adenosylmethionine ribosyltransferase-isomerase QueA [Legionella spiritensis]|uniref:S-adenosylmethionine:tRNA ribosyltransferase-isomerase n=1 Tax=Legionella spiritensis TaxID=452 RepID=A0A0W0Z9A3_LEGSP|nr:tRNA preQ1(34) S-adenosylmethionine ribosyltransferase-isomerase QueA [Legionella spiritensis]KTD65704.1 S-adenosylmethionine:tRNA ribosyltransferase-isomerase [Legionella spiritensis]SNV43393.1 S-adenosylmethionine:tRNA ribosyltransferase-isomerase [Legionella spiritensis]